MAEIILCAMAAMVGAGFASGREIMRFFSRYGAFSWVLVGFAAGVTVFMIRRMLSLEENDSRAGRIMLSLFYVTLGGSMTAAAGELWALTVPVPYARTLGSAVTLCGCLIVADGPLKRLAWFGRALIPLLLAVMVLCLRLPGTEGERKSVSWQEGTLALLSAAGYCGLNGMTAAGVLRGSWSCRDRNRITLMIGLVTAMLLALGNAALLPHARQLRDAPLPTVMLLRNYGKAGYDLSAAALYLAASTTLIAVLRGLTAFSVPYLARYGKTVIGLAVMAVSLLGFGGIVGTAYPALGWVYLILLFRPERRRFRRY